MNTHRRCSSRVVMIVLLVALAATPAFAQYSWRNIVSSSQRIEMESWGGMGYGEVSTAFASFVLDLDYTGPLTLEVVVTEERQGTEYSDDDSVLFLFDNDGYLIAENDDSPLAAGYASVINGAMIEWPGRYYAVVTTHPNWPELDANDQFMALWEDGASSIAFDLVVEYGMRDEFNPDNFQDVEDWGAGETEVFFHEFPAFAFDLVYDGYEAYATGIASEGPEIYRLTTTSSGSVSITARARDGAQGDTVLFVIDDEGYVIAENDDDAGNGGSLIYDVYLEANRDYWVAVSTYPNWPNTDAYGAVEGFAFGGSDYVEYELIVGPPQEYVYDDPYYGEMETEIWFEDFPMIARPLSYDGFESYDTGTVAEGIEVYRFSPSTSGSVSVTARAVGGVHGDTTLVVIDSDGWAIAENDDGAGNGGSLIYDVYLDANQDYWIVVSTYPNWPNYTEYGEVEGYAYRGSGYVEYELIVGPPQEDIYDDPYYGNLPTEIWFEDFYDLAIPLHYSGGEVIRNGEVADNVELYRVTVDEPVAVGTEVYEAYGDYGDTMLFIIDDTGWELAQDDDGAGNGGSLIPEVTLYPDTTYYFAITTYPNRPNYDDYGNVEGFAYGGETYVEYEFIIGAPREYDGYGDGGYWETETSIWFDEFPMMAETVWFDGMEQTLTGTVVDGVAIYQIMPSMPMRVSLEAVAADGEYGDLIMVAIDSDGYILAEDDDSGGNGGSLIHDVELNTTEGTWVAIAAYPNWPNRDYEGYIEGFPTGGDVAIEFEFTIGDPQEGAYGDDGGFGDIMSYPDDGMPAYSIQEVAANAQFIPVMDGRGTGSGEVGIGYEAFEFEINGPSYVTLEVIVTEVRQGTEYADDDSKLSVFGAEGEWYASDDDGGEGYASMIEDLYLSQPGVYYAVVTTYPNEPETNMGFFDYVDATGGSNFAFDLVISMGSGGR